MLVVWSKKRNYNGIEHTPSYKNYYKANNIFVYKFYNIWKPYCKLVGGYNKQK